MIHNAKAISDAHRLNILKLLSKQEMGVCEIMHSLGLSQPAISHHLKILRQVNFVTSEKQGKVVYYRLNIKGIKEFINEFTDFFNIIENYKPKSSPLRENPSFCELIGLKSSICEKEY